MTPRRGIPDPERPADAFGRLVLTDGRSVYTPPFGGVYWDIQDPVLEDIERIEMLPGA